MSVVAAPPLGQIMADYSIPITGASTQIPQAFTNGTQVIQVATDSPCSIAYGVNPTAVTTAHRMAANETRFYIAAPGNFLAVISNV